MRHKTIREKNQYNDLSFINLAIQYDQKKVISHSVIQYHLETKITGSIPGWNGSGVVYKVFISALIGIMFPITSMLNILLPSKCCPSVSNFALRPFVKFLNGAVSYILFIFFLIFIGAFQRLVFSIGNSVARLPLTTP